MAGGVKNNTIVLAAEGSEGCYVVWLMPLEGSEGSYTFSRGTVVRGTLVPIAALPILSQP